MRPSETSLIPLPGHDRFLTWSAATVLRRDRGSAPELQRALRPLFPDVGVRETELGALTPEPGWYVYRDGMYQPEEPAGAAGHTMGRGVAVIDDAGRLTEVDDLAADLLSTDGATLRGMYYVAFIAPEAAELFDHLIPILDEEGSLKSRWLMYRAGGGSSLLDVALLRAGAGSHLHVVSMRPAAHHPGGST